MGRGKKKLFWMDRHVTFYFLCKTVAFLLDILGIKCIFFLFLVFFFFFTFYLFTPVRALFSSRCPAGRGFGWVNFVGKSLSGL